MFYRNIAIQCVLLRRHGILKLHIYEQLRIKSVSFPQFHIFKIFMLQSFWKKLVKVVLSYFVPCVPNKFCISLFFRHEMTKIKIIKCLINFYNCITLLKNSNWTNINYSINLTKFSHERTHQQITLHLSNISVSNHWTTRWVIEFLGLTGHYQIDKWYHNSNINAQNRTIVMFWTLIGLLISKVLNFRL